VRQREAPAPGTSLSWRIRCTVESNSHAVSRNGGTGRL
jgi:hypothetical protein